MLCRARILICARATACARDDEQFWVTNKAVADEPSDQHCAGCSMYYKWNLDGTLKSYTTFAVGEGASSYRFLCDVADKF